MNSVAGSIATPTTRGLYLGVAVVMTGLVIWGFWPFYAALMTGTASGPWVLWVHAAVFSGWMALLFTQALLVHRRELRAHQGLGRFGVLLGLAVLLTGFAVTFTMPGLRVAAGTWTLDEAAAFLMLPLGDLILFVGFFTAAIVYRRRPELHKRLIVLTTLVLVFPAVARAGAPYGIAAVAALWFTPLAVLMLHDWFTRGRVARVYFVGLVFMLLAFARVGVMNSEAWVSFARPLVRLPPPVLHFDSTGTGAPVVLIHGSLADHSYWPDANQVAPLADRYRVITYSRRYNHPNDIAATDNHSARVEADDLLQLLDTLGLDSAHLVGHSYGGYTALLFALDHPERVRSLVLAEPPILPWVPETSARFMANVWTPLAAAFAESDEAGLEFTAQWYFDSPFADISPAWQILFRNNVREWRALAESADAFPPIDPARVRALTVPTLVLSGARNAGGFNDAIDLQLIEYLPDARRVVIQDAGHEMFQDAPAASAATIRAFIDGTAR